MSYIGGKPFIDRCLDSLSDSEIRRLRNVINDSSASPVGNYCLYGPLGVKLTDVLSDYKKFAFVNLGYDWIINSYHLGFLIRLGTNEWGFLVWQPHSLLMTIAQLKQAKDKVEFNVIQEQLTTEEFRRVLNDLNDTDDKLEELIASMSAGNIDASMLPNVESLSSMSVSDFDKINGKAFIYDELIFIPVTKYDEETYRYLTAYEDGEIRAISLSKYDGTVHYSLDWMFTWKGIQASFADIESRLGTKLYKHQISYQGGIIQYINNSSNPNDATNGFSISGSGETSVSNLVGVKIEQRGPTSYYAVGYNTIDGTVGYGSVDISNYINNGSDTVTEL